MKVQEELIYKMIISDKIKCDINVHEEILEIIYVSPLTRAAVNKIIKKTSETLNVSPLKISSDYHIKLTRLNFPENNPYKRE